MKSEVGLSHLILFEAVDVEPAMLFDLATMMSPKLTAAKLFELASRVLFELDGNQLRVIRQRCDA